MKVRGLKIPSLMSIGRHPCKKNSRYSVRNSDQGRKNPKIPSNPIASVKPAPRRIPSIAKADMRRIERWSSKKRLCLL